MSIYSLCSKACDRFISGEAKAPHSPFFTEIDVVNEAAKLANGIWSSQDYRRALKKAQDAVGTKWREGKLSRYGPVHLSGAPEGDYARIGSKIVYASASTAPAVFETPNGDFPSFRIEKDPLKRQGRRTGTSRSDLEKWGDQNIVTTTIVEVPAIVPDDKELLKELRARVEYLEERERAREKVYA